MAYKRYEYLDAYTGEELRRRYQSLGPKGRIHLMTRLSREGQLSHEVVQWAVEDQNAEVRMWACLHFSFGSEHEIPLSKDPDELVRASFWEGIVRADDRWWLENFKRASTMERLAMMRNPLVGLKLVHALFDPEESELKLDLWTRRDLAMAYLSNERALKRGQGSYADFRKAVGSDDAWGYTSMQTDYKEHFHSLWRLAAKWPREYGIPWSVYRHVPADEATKAAAYQTCDHPDLRRRILENDLPPVYGDGPDGADYCMERLARRAGKPSELLKLALEDSDEECRNLAARLAPQVPEKPPKAYLRIVWKALISLIMLGFALALFATAKTRSETILFALVILVYGECAVLASWLELVLREQSALAAQRHLRISELLKDPELSVRVKKQAKGDLEDLQKDVYKSIRARFVTVVAYWLLVLLVLYKLITSVS